MVNRVRQHFWPTAAPSRRNHNHHSSLTVRTSSLVNMPNLDFTSAGFELYTNDDLEDQNASREKSLEPLKPVRDGFTRSPEEGQELICPNCKDELCTGETEVKRQIWVIKACGHVYCGDCAGAGTRKGKERSKAGKSRGGACGKLGKCVIDGCGQQIKGKGSLFQVYL